MSNTHRLAGAVAIAACALAVAAAPILAEEQATGWSDKAEFSYVVTDGNSETMTLGLKNTLIHKWEKSAFTLKAGAIRAESTTTSSFAVGLVDDFIVDEESETEKTAENYFLNGRYDRQIHERFFWYGSAGWERNRFAGIDNRYSAQAGVGNIWIDREEIKFKTDYAVTYTDQEDVVEIEDRDNSFLGARFAWAYLHAFNERTTYENLLALDLNLEESDRWRGDMVNSLAVTMTDKLALKVTLQWLYENDPAFELIPLFELPPVPGAEPDDFVPNQLDELDTIFTASLVVTF